MANSSLTGSARAQRSKVLDGKISPQRRRRRNRRDIENSDVLISAVVSTYLLTHLHHVLHRAELAAIQEGRDTQAANFSQLRKLLCMDARSMKDASAIGLREGDLDKRNENQLDSKAA